jgi:hypothetical protein
MTMMFRVILTVAVILGFGLINTIYAPISTLAVGQAAGGQFLPSDGAYLQSMYTMSAWGFGNRLLSIFFIAALIALWIKPVIQLFRNNMNTLPVILMAGLVSGAFIYSSPASAYYADNDYAETFMVLPNESAFWLPDVGDNKNSQVAFGSEDYYKANKIAAKRFDVTTHVRLPNSGIFSNKYVSPGRLIKVDRSPTAREWVKAKHRGTGASDESFPCQSAEGLDVTVGVSIGTSVKEENAPKFLYTFGVNPPKGDPNDANVVFTSVYYGKSLSQVMDEKVRPRVQSLVCDEITKRTLDKDNAEAAAIMTAIQAKVSAYADSVGITLDFIGWADTFEFTPSVQKAIDDRYIVDKLGSSLTVLNAIANLKVQEGLGKGLETHGLPIVVTPDMMNVLSGLASKVPSIAATPPPPAPGK